MVDLAKQVKQLVISSLAFSIGLFLGGAVKDWRERRRQRRMGVRRDESSLKAPGRTFAIVTTAALPWRTGTSINPMLRAAHLAADSSRKVLLVVPWLAPAEQQLLYPKGTTFATEQEQEEFILEEARKRTGLACNFKVYWYPGRYFPGFGSIFPLTDITEAIPAAERDVAILEEPEHLNWFQHTSRWTDKFHHVVGIMHTNYLAYVREGQATGFANAAAVYRINKWVCRIHCHKVIKLSDAVQKLPHQVTCNVHGVAGNFLKVGAAKAEPGPPGQHRFTKGAYFIGKAVWGKGYRELIELMAYHLETTNEQVPLDVVGSGEDLTAIQAAAADSGLSWAFLGAKDHGDKSMWDYQVFVNPSTSDVVATTTAEALAMGKWVVVGDIPCNEFFKQFPNCLTYSSREGFSKCLDHALLQEPAPMEEETLRKLSWEAATDRLLEVGSVKQGEWPSTVEQRYANTLWRMYRSVVGFTALREALGMSSTSGEEPEVMAGQELSDADLQEAAQAEDWDLDWLFKVARPVS